ncbi:MULTISPECIES: hypothetical protein [Comamonas]|uniref:Immunity protein 63 domain-containing protein n=1 Tax=Comamonas terrigena TaxID=32013 RepID=A0A2A7UWY3_COMTR|nr:MULTISPECIES: hypothetical protein [Comamonas]MBD9531278.1 hypothetical protein [Comamonas sp. CMM01]PEH89800.1 hypothetical protein CRM82_15375 [Comamonas terrigena]BBL25034.1 hypothetical protein CT3_24890 [Comamonas terrigena NBRC 13299]SUY71378.1 Uncharacterised protein [Comamonas terrigena]
MKTDWHLIRSMMETAIGACEQMEAMGYNESHRHLSIETSQGPVTVFDLMVSSFTYPESIRYQIIRERHDAGADQPYVHEFSRLLVAMAQASAELVGGKDAAPASASLEQMLAWYKDLALPNLRKAIEQAEIAPPGKTPV